MWTVKIMTVKKDHKENEKLYVTKCINCNTLRETYKFALELCRKLDIGLVALYQDIDLDSIFVDDVTKEHTLAKYQLFKGSLGGIFLYRKDDANFCTIRENQKND